MKRKQLILAVTIAMILVLIPQTAFGNSTVSFSNRPVIKAETVDQMTIKVSWSKVKGAAGYQLYRALPGKAFVKIKTLKSPGSLQYVDKGRKSNTAYYYRVKAYKISQGQKTYGRYSWSVRGDAGLPYDVNTFRVEGAGKNGISFFWGYDGKADGCYVYRGDSKDGPFDLIAQVAPRENGYWYYVDDTVQSGETYYYQVQPYADCKGTRLKGRVSKTLSASAIYDSPVETEMTLSNGDAANELIFKVTMDAFNYDTVLAVSTDLTVEKENRKIMLQQSWQNGDAEESRETFMHISGLSKDGVTYKDNGSITVKAGDTIYIKATCSDAISVGVGETNRIVIYCLYNGKASALDSM